jgi:acyl-CoA thioesterase FadM
MLIADADVTFVIVDTKTGKPVSLKGELLRTIKTF